jgi:orotidine-5'-phosphate decarboxylase
MESPWELYGGHWGNEHSDDLARARALAPDLTFLVPGVGAQGGDAEAVLRVGKASNGLGLIVNASREVIFSADPASTARRMHGQLMPNS